MRRLCLVVALIGSCSGLVSGVSAQEATERFIPIGESPGVSRVTTVIGEVVALDPQRRGLTVLADGQPRELRIDESTRVWIDRSASGRSSETGGYEDLRAGDTVEIKWRDPQLVQPVDWVKVRRADP